MRHRLFHSAWERRFALVQWIALALHAFDYTASQGLREDRRAVAGSKRAIVKVTMKGSGGMTVSADASVSPPETPARVDGPWHVGMCVRGKVQGVSFRAKTQMQASRLKVSGWVRNMADGSVQMEAYGSEDAVRAFENFVRSGPVGTVVSSTHYDLPVGPVPAGFVAPVGFKIRRSEPLG